MVMVMQPRSCPAAERLTTSTAASCARMETSLFQTVLEITVPLFLRLSFPKSKIKESDTYSIWSI